jgi:hypothetical protein
LSGAGREDDAGSVCTTVCTPVDEAAIEAAIANVTRLLAVTNDDQVAADLVRERAALRHELRAAREGNAGVVRLHKELAPRR